MTYTEARDAQALADRFGRKVARRLDAGAADLPHDFSERLRVARVQALAHRKQLQARPAGALLASGRASAIRFGDQGPGLWGRIASALPLVVLAFGLVFIQIVQTDRRATELAEVDAALLTDDLPPAAYADPGFVHFLKAQE